MSRLNLPQDRDFLVLPLINGLPVDTEEIRDFGNAAEVLKKLFFRNHDRLKHACDSTVKHACGLVRDNLKMTIGDRIKERMGELEIKVPALASACAVSPQAVYQWLKGDSKGLRPENLVAAAEKLATTEKWLATGKGAKVRYMEPVTTEERDLLVQFRKLKPSFRAVLHTFINLSEERKEIFSDSLLGKIFSVQGVEPSDKWDAKAKKSGK
jgi:transcriptional regulator with XRE-family HTH domain